jgi:hypothetical protein
MPFSSVSEKPGLRYVTNACFTGREWSFRELRSQSPISPCRRYRSDQPENLGCAEKTAFVAQGWRRIALFASLGRTCAMEMSITW